MHLAHRNSLFLQEGLSRHLRDLGELREIEWRRHKPADLPGIVHGVAEELRPTLVLAQVQQGGTAITAALVREIQERCGCKAVVWDGDRHHEPEAPERRWYIELGKVCDMMLTPSESDPLKYERLGVRRCCYWHPGIDERKWYPVEEWIDRSGVVFLGGRYSHLAGYQRRTHAIEYLASHLGDALTVYGHGWGDRVNHRRIVRPEQEREVYGSAQLAICASMWTHVEGYTSDRLFRAMGCGSAMLVERFARMESLGLVEGKNYYGWSTPDELVSLTRSLLADPVRCAGLRAEALKLSHRHRWIERVQWLSTLVNSVS